MIRRVLKRVQVFPTTTIFMPTYSNGSGKNGLITLPPQLYWYIGKEVADYAILAKWWAAHSYGCNIYIGQAPYLISPDAKDQAWRSADEITKQIALNRTIPEIKGSMYFSAKFMNKNPLSVKEKMIKEHYRFPSLTPVNPLVVPVIPAQPANPAFVKDGNDLVLSWQKQEKQHFICRLPV